MPLFGLTSWSGTSNLVSVTNGGPLASRSCFAACAPRRSDSEFCFFLQEVVDTGFRDTNFNSQKKGRADRPAIYPPIGWLMSAMRAVRVVEKAATIRIRSANWGNGSVKAASPCVPGFVWADQSC